MSASAPKADVRVLKVIENSAGILNYATTIHTDGKIRFLPRVDDFQAVIKVPFLLSDIPLELCSTNDRLLRPGFN